MSASNNAGEPEGPTNIETRLFINGEFVPSKSGKTFDVINPATEKLTASPFEAGAEDVDLAVDAAKAALPAWSALGGSGAPDSSTSSRISSSKLIISLESSRP